MPPRPPSTVHQSDRAASCSLRPARREAGKDARQCQRLARFRTLDEPPPRCSMPSSSATYGPRPCRIRPRLAAEPGQPRSLCRCQRDAHRLARRDLPDRPHPALRGLDQRRAPRNCSRSSRSPTTTRRVRCSITWSQTLGAKLHTTFKPVKWLKLSERVSFEYSNGQGQCQHVAHPARSSVPCGSLPRPRSMTAMPTGNIVYDSYGKPSTAASPRRPTWPPASPARTIVNPGSPA